MRYRLHMDTKMDVAAKLASLLGQLNTVIVGKEAQVRDCVACLLAGGHLLIEDVPGVGKTTLAHALSHTFGLQFSRVQFTSDLMPGDLSGVAIYDRGQQAFVFHPGPLFTQVLLADEINRASPKTQRALLEAMEEKQVTVEGETRPLPSPFFVIATQNPHDQLGTFALPESQLDRFLMRISLGYPDRASERASRQNGCGLVFSLARMLIVIGLAPRRRLLRPDPRHDRPVHGHGQGGRPQPARHLQDRVPRIQVGFQPLVLDGRHPGCGRHGHEDPGPGRVPVRPHVHARHPAPPPPLRRGHDGC